MVWVVWRVLESIEHEEESSLKAPLAHTPMDVSSPGRFRTSWLELNT